MGVQCVHLLERSINFELWRVWDATRIELSGDLIKKTCEGRVVLCYMYQYQSDSERKTVVQVPVLIRGKTDEGRRASPSKAPQAPYKLARLSPGVAQLVTPLQQAPG